MNLDEIRLERQKWMTWKNIKPLREALDSLEEIENDFNRYYPDIELPQRLQLVSTACSDDGCKPSVTNLKD